MALEDQFKKVPLDLKEETYVCVCAKTIIFVSLLRNIIIFVSSPLMCSQIPAHDVLGHANYCAAVCFDVFRVLFSEHGALFHRRIHPRSLAGSPYGMVLALI